MCGNQRELVVGIHFLRKVQAHRYHSWEADPHPRNSDSALCDPVTDSRSSSLGSLWNGTMGQFSSFWDQCEAGVHLTTNVLEFYKQKKHFLA